mmetsp:Transcript_32114/g.93245  ORF Transcript_32114/g.93245 Transcript_32114/m.93245 type:complete len:285 (-) Transcript_32114:2103-2957(-)
MIAWTSPSRACSRLKALRSVSSGSLDLRWIRRCAANSSAREGWDEAVEATSKLLVDPGPLREWGFFLNLGLGLMVGLNVQCANACSSRCSSRVTMGLDRLWRCFSTPCLYRWSKMELPSCRAWPKEWRRLVSRFLILGWKVWSSVPCTSAALRLVSRLCASAWRRSWTDNRRPSSSGGGLFSTSSPLRVTGGESWARGLRHGLKVHAATASASSSSCLAWRRCLSCAEKLWRRVWMGSTLIAVSPGLRSLDLAASCGVKVHPSTSRDALTVSRRLARSCWSSTL